MVSGHVSSGQYVLFQRDPRLGEGAPLLEVGRLVVMEVDGDTRIEHWFLYTNAPVASGYAKYVRPSSALPGLAVGLWFRGAGSAPTSFDANVYEARIALSTGCTIEYINATCDRLSGTSVRVTRSAASSTGGTTQNQVDLGIYDITQGRVRVGVLVVTPFSSGTLEQWLLFEKGTTSKEGTYAAPDPTIGGAYTLTYLGGSTPDLTGRAVVTVNAVCAVAA